MKKKDETCKSATQNMTKEQQRQRIEERKRAGQEKDLTRLQVHQIAVAATLDTLYDFADWARSWDPEDETKRTKCTFEERTRLASIVQEYAEMRDDIGSPGLEYAVCGEEEEES